MIKEIEIENIDTAIALFGNQDENRKHFKEELKVDIRATGSKLTVEGAEADVLAADRAIEILKRMIAKGDLIDKNTISILAEIAKNGDLDDIDFLFQTVAVTAKGKPIKCKSPGQAYYVRMIRKNNLIFGIGPAGTGKTYLAVALAVMAYKNKDVERIILTRPAVEAGEKLGFLPGDLQTKVDPYLRPLFDALQEMLGQETYARMMERGTIEVAPLAYMRGRTLSDSFIILDEAQNTTREQMKMFLTRMGHGSKVVVTGDITQIDLPHAGASGLVHASRILNDIDEIAIVHLTNKDVVRHNLVQKIIQAYERAAGTGASEENHELDDIQEKNQ